MKNFQIIKINEDSSIKVEYLKTDYTDIPNPDGLKGEDLFVHITNIISEFQRESDFLNPEPDVLTTLEIYPDEYAKSPIFVPETIGSINFINKNFEKLKRNLL
jgi:hypothetical protein